MTTTTAPVASRTLGELIASIPLRPAEGWLSLVATAGMVVVLAGSLLEAAWTPFGDDSGFLTWIALVGVAFGTIGPKIGWGRWRTHVIGAAFAGLVLPLVVGGVILGPGTGWEPAALAERFAATAEVARKVWLDLVVLARPVTTETAHYHLIFGALVWGAGMLAGFAVFGHHRPLDAIVVVGLAIVVNMTFTRHDQILYMVAFTSFALLLLIRSHVFEEELTWVRRRIGDPAAVGQLYLVAGAQFVIVAVLGSMLLTTTASSAPLQAAWADLPARLQAASQWLQRFAPPGGDLRGLGAVTFGDNAVTTGLWQPSSRIAFRAEFARGEVEPFKWRAGTYGEYTTFGWNYGPTRTESTPPNTVLLNPDQDGDRPTTEYRREISFRVTPDAFVGGTIVGPNTLLTVDRQTNVLVLGDDGWFTTVEGDTGGSSYTASALVPVFSAAEGGITEPRLRAAGSDYPAELVDIYTAVPQGSIGPAAAILLDTIRAQVRAPDYADPANAYDLARTMESYFRNPANFTYREDVRSERNARCDGLSTVECFAVIRVGYCDFYASTMAILMRASGVPARVAFGFLPGDRGSDGSETVGAWSAHYWVEVYFPGIGWIEFDPTGGNVGQPQAIPTGSPEPATPRPSTDVPTAAPNTGAPGTIPPVAGPTDEPAAGIGPFIAIAVILVVGFVAIGIAALRRTPRRPMHPDKAWGSMASLAARFGLGPRPSQTVYEYAGSLGDAVPAARVELTTIARAKVEVAYGRLDLAPDRLRRIAEAYGRLRLAILGMVLRRGFRRRPKRR